jgi:hypothetical protein
MQVLAPTGSIATTEAMRKVCEGYFTFKSLGPTVVKGPGYDSFFSRDLPPKKYSASEATMHWRSCANWAWRISQLA